MKVLSLIFVVFLCIHFAEAQQIKIASPTEVKAMGFGHRK